MDKINRSKIECNIFFNKTYLFLFEYFIDNIFICLNDNFE